MQECKTQPLCKEFTPSNHVSQISESILPNLMRVVGKYCCGTHYAC